MHELNLVNNNMLIKGDSYEVLPRLKKYGFQNGNKIDLVLTDPPYNTTACSWELELDLPKLWELLYDCTSENAVFVMTGAQPFTSKLLLSNEKDYRCHWVWNKGQAANFLNAKRHPLKVHEDILIFSKKPSFLYNPQGLVKFNKTPKMGKPNKDSSLGTHNRAGNFQEWTNYPKSIINETNTNNLSKVHPTQKPLKLFNYLLKTYSNENQIILDPFMGSGTTGVSCVNLNRQFIGIEQSQEYYDIATARINDTEYQPEAKAEQTKLF